MATDGLDGNACINTLSRPYKLGGDNALTCTPSVVSDDGWIAGGIVQKVVGLHGALAHCTRLRIVQVLSREGEVTPNEFAEMLGESQQNVSKHLKTLSQAGVVVGRKDGSCTLYSLRDREAMTIVEAAVGFVERQLREMAAQAGLTSAVVERAGESSAEDTG